MNSQAIIQADLSKLIDNILDRLAKLQTPAHQKYWHEGTFPNYRSNKIWRYKRNDNSIFHTASIVFILQKCRPFLSHSQQYIIDSISKKAKDSFKLYRNKEGAATFNFYPTKPSRHFANGMILHRLKHFQLPDDADDTALIYLCDASLDIQYLQNKLRQHHAGNKANIPKQWQTRQAYSTWFGKNMPIEFDVVVLSNILLALNYRLTDENILSNDSFEIIKDTIVQGTYLKHGFGVSPNYAQPIIIAYHLARLLANMQSVDYLKVKMLEQLQQLAPVHRLEALLIEITRYNLGERPGELTFTVQEIQELRFSYFIAGLLSAYPNFLARSFRENPFFHIKWQCPAHNLALALEYLVKNKNASLM